MSVIKIRGFAGMKPIVEPKLLGENEAQLAQDPRLYSGNIEPFRVNTTVTPLKSAGTVQTIFRAQSTGSEATNWFEFSGDVDVIRSPVQDDSFSRLYWTGDGAPKYATASVAFAAGSGAYPRNSYLLGVP